MTETWASVEPRTFRVGPNSQLWELGDDGEYHLIGVGPPMATLGVGWTEDDTIDFWVADY